MDGIVLDGRHNEGIGHATTKRNAQGLACAAGEDQLMLPSQSGLDPLPCIFKRCSSCPPFGMG